MQHVWPAPHVGLCDRAVSARLPELRHQLEDAAPAFRNATTRRETVAQFLDVKTPPLTRSAIRYELAHREDWFGPKLPSPYEVEKSCKHLELARVDADRIQMVYLHGKFIGRGRLRIVLPLPLSNTAVDAALHGSLSRSHRPQRANSVAPEHQTDLPPQTSLGFKPMACSESTIPRRRSEVSTTRR